MFSTRLPPALAENALSRAAAEAMADGRPLFDLPETNPTVVGLEYPADLARTLLDPAATTYQPEPFGLPAARAAVAASYAAHQAVDPHRVVLAASTSDAYGLLFKLLTDAGDQLLVPEPSYPLFDLLTRLDAVHAVPYQLDPDGHWAIDRESLERALTPRTRAVLIVSPNNPTGSRITVEDREWIVGVAATHGLALIADEVFADYDLTPRPTAASLCGEARALTFTLGGLSKSAGLPQMKLAWIVASGPSRDVDEALTRLAVIADTYLSVSTPVQLAAPRLLEAGATIREAIRARLRYNLGRLRDGVRAHPSLRLFEPEGGWSAVIQVPSIVSEETLALKLIQKQRVRVHPGYFFDFPRESYLIVSLLPEPGRFDEALNRALPLMAGDRW